MTDADYITHKQLNMKTPHMTPSLKLARSANTALEHPTCLKISQKISKFLAGIVIRDTVKSD